MLQTAEQWEQFGQSFLYDIVSKTTCRVRSRARPVDEKARVTKRRGRRVVRRLDAETKRRVPQEGKQVLLPLPEIRMLDYRHPHFYLTVKTVCDRIKKINFD